MSPRRGTEDINRCPRLAGHFSSEAVLRTELWQFFGANVIFNFRDRFSIRSSNTQAPSSREIPNHKLQAGADRSACAGLSIGAWNFSGAWMLKFGAFKSVRIPTGYPVLHPLLSHSQVLENPRTATFPVLMPYPRPLSEKEDQTSS